MCMTISKFRKSIIFCVVIFTVLFCSCSDIVDGKIDQLLEKVGKNKIELLKVINHYRQNAADSLKLKAAYFLIENIDGLTTLDTNYNNADKYFTFLSKMDRSGLIFPVLTRGFDSMIAESGVPPSVQPKYVDELTTVPSTFLIKNIDSAFYVWQNMPWAKGVSFENFCEYILPYRCTHTYSSNIREFFLQRFRELPDSIASLSNMMTVGNFIINNLNPWFKEDPNITQRYPFLNPIKFSDLLRGRVGACNDANSVRVAALRALGVATAYDQIPNWGNSNLPHFWYKIIDPKHDTVKMKITNENIDRKTQHVISATSYDEPHFNGMPVNIDVSFGRTVPKVYRQCFSKQKNSLASIAGKDEIPPYFQNVRLKDVTTEYVETAPVKISINTPVDAQRYLYLCVFDNQQWLPVAWGEIDNGTTEFRDMGKNIVYLPAYYEDGNMVPAASPFLLTLDGTVESLNPIQQTETVKLFTKFPVRSYVIRWLSYSVGGRFQFANKADFSDSVTVYKVNHLPFYKTEVEVKEQRPFRYLLFQFEGLKYLEMSEIEFYGLNKNGKEIKLSGKAIGNPGYHPYKIAKLFDSIDYNLYRADTSMVARYVGIDLGENNASSITKIKFMPYSDDNAVKEGDSYQLYYWDNEWISLGIKIAGKGKFVQFINVPRNALLLLKNIGEGVQERIFLYKHGKQIFW
jgi:hypothetical protein